MYVDGFNLYHGLHSQHGRRYLWLDLVALAQNLRPRSEVVKTKYFTAPVLDEPEALSRQTTYHNALRAYRGEHISIITGRYQRKKKECRTCGSEWIEREEKETDVNIAVSLVADAARDAMDAALIVSADSDLTPAVRTARELRPELFITAGFPPNRKSAQLRQLMPHSFPIKESRIKQSLLPDEVRAVSGHTYQRPSTWR